MDDLRQENEDLKKVLHQKQAQQEKLRADVKQQLKVGVLCFMCFLFICVLAGFAT
jgi:hypothetical protein